MKRTPDPNDDSWENDPIWKLLDESPPVTASPRFADDVVRAARLAGQESSWWSRLFRPVPLAGFVAAAAACVIAVISLKNDAPATRGETLAVIDTQAFSEIQEVAETETLLSAVENLDDFSDMELVSLVGF